jgi:hypothetical protein
MERTLMNECVEALLEGRVVISSLAQTVARRKRTGLTYYTIPVSEIRFISY